MSDVMTFSKRTAAGLEEVLRTLLLDAESKVPSDRLRISSAQPNDFPANCCYIATGKWK